MRREEKAKLFDALTHMAHLLGEKINQARIEGYIEVLEEYDIKKITHAIKRCLTECKFFPKPAEIISRLETPKDLLADANEMAGIIIETYPRYGSYSPREAKKALGELLWRVVELYGGWNLLCESKTSEMGTVRAQLRELSRSVLIRKENINSPQDNLLPHQKKEVKKLGDILKSTEITQKQLK